MDISVIRDNTILLLLVIPALACSLLPLRHDLKYTPAGTIYIAAPALAAVIVLCAVAGCTAELSSKQTIIAALAAVLVIHLLLSRGDLRVRLFCFFNSAMITGISMLYGCVLAAPFEADGSYTTMSPPAGLICLAVSLVLSAAGFRTLYREIPYLISSDDLSMGHGLSLAVTFLISVMLFWATPKYATVVMTGRVRITILCVLILAPCSFLLIYHSIWRIAVNLTENAELREANELMAMEQKRYEELRTYMDETRSLRHDFRQHLLVMDEYARKGENQKLTDYIAQFTISLSDHRGLIAANPALDAVASHYEKLAADQDTHIKWNIELQRELPLKESDLITIFGNLVENAVTAVRGLDAEKRWVHVNARMLSDEMLGLTVKNPYEGEIKRDRNGLPANDAPGHGIGLSSVSAVVGRYGGALDINTDGGIFTAGVLLYTSEKEMTAEKK